MAKLNMKALSLRWSRLSKDQAKVLQLGVLAPDQVMYRLEWSQCPLPVDERLPAALIDGLSTAFCRVAGVSFLADTMPSGERVAHLSAARRWLRYLVKPNERLKWQLHGAVWTRRIDGLNEPLLMSTDVPRHARSLFSIGAWHLAASQVVFFFPREAMPPAFSDSLVRRATLTKDWQYLMDQLSELGLWGVLTQGHDGSCLGLLPLAPDFAGRFAHAVAEEAYARGWEWRDESMFEEGCISPLS